VLGRLEEALAPMRRDEPDGSGPETEVAWPTVASFDEYTDHEPDVAESEAVGEGIDDLIVAAAETEPDVVEPAPVGEGIDDLIVAAAETEPDVVEPEPVSEGIDDLIVAVAVPGSEDTSADHTSVEDPRALDGAVCLAYISTPTGYRLVPLAVELPAPGETIALGEHGPLVVSRVGKSPLPLDRRVCVYVEQPLAPASALVTA
jgi:hypothetical protein